MHLCINFIKHRSRNKMIKARFRHAGLEH